MMYGEVAPIFVDGPLKGQHHLVPGYLLTTGYSFNAPVETDDPWVEFDQEVHTYRFYRYGAFERIMWVGSINSNLSSAEVGTYLFGVMFTDAAKAAVA